MQRVRSRRRDHPIELGRRHAHRRKRREIIAVDQAVRDARMVRLLLRFLVQDRCGLELLRVVLVVEIDRAVQRERVEDRGLGIVRIMLVKLLHRLFVMFGAGLVVDLVVIL